MDPKDVKDAPDVQGEGNYDATRRYDEALKKSVEKGDAEELAKKAKEALDGPQGEELRKADDEGKRGEPEPARK